MNNSIYANLKEVLKIGISEKKLSYYKAMTDKYLEDDLAYKNYEEGLVSYFSNLEKKGNSLYGNVDSELIKIKLGITNIYEERNFFAKLFMRDYESKYSKSYKLEDGVDVRDIFRDFASDELKSDVDFAVTVSTLDGKYLSAMNEDIRSNQEIVCNAINNDTSKDVDSFLSASGDALKNPDIAIMFFNKKKEQDLYLSATETYKKVFQRDENGNFADDIFKNNVQSYWLSDSKFIVDLAKLNIYFIPYIVEGKISTTSPSEKKTTAVKKYEKHS